MWCHLVSEMDCPLLPMGRWWFGASAFIVFFSPRITAHTHPVTIHGHAKMKWLHISWNRGGQKIAQFFVRLNFIECRPNVKLILLLKSGEKFVIVLVAKSPTAPQVCRYTTLWNVSVLKATIDNKTISVTTHFKSSSSSSNAIMRTHWTFAVGYKLQDVTVTLQSRQ